MSPKRRAELFRLIGVLERAQIECLFYLLLLFFAACHMLSLSHTFLLHGSKGSTSARRGNKKLKNHSCSDKGDAKDEDCDVAGGKGVALVAALTRAQVKAALLGRECRSVGLAYARNKQRGAQRQHELELLDGVFGVVLHAACCLRFDNRIHLLAEHGDKGAVLW